MIASIRQLAKAVDRSPNRTARMCRRPDWPFGAGPWPPGMVPQIRTWMGKTLSPDGRLRAGRVGAKSTPTLAARVATLEAELAALRKRPPGAAQPSAETSAAVDGSTISIRGRRYLFHSPEQRRCILILFQALVKAPGVPMPREIFLPEDGRYRPDFRIGKVFTRPARRGHRAKPHPIIADGTLIPIGKFGWLIKPADDWRPESARTPRFPMRTPATPTTAR